MEDEINWSIKVPRKLRERFCEVAKAAGTTGPKLIRLYMSRIVLQSVKEEGGKEDG